MPRIFISYRREDSAGHTGRLNDRLTTRFGRESIFMDVDTIPPGVDFVEVIQQAVSSCDVLIAVIGRQWLSRDDGHAVQRGTHHTDFVRVEIATGLERQIKIIPVLVQGAAMPAEDQLPEDLKALARVNALELSDARWSHDTDHLIDTIQKALKPTQVGPKRRSLAKLLAVLLVLTISASGIYFLSGGLEHTLQKVTAYRTEGKIRDAREQLNLMSIPYNADELVARAERGDAQAIELLLDAGMDPNIRNSDGLLALGKAAWKGQLKVVDVLIDRGADANGMSDKGVPALIFAAAHGHADVVHRLLAKGADINAVTDDGDTALTVSIGESHFALAESLLAAGADVNARTTEGRNALIEASEKSADVVQMLLAHGANPHQKNRDGWTALMSAVRSGKNDIVQILLSKGVDINAQNTQGSTALMQAVKEGHSVVVGTLLAAGADSNVRRVDGITALMDAARRDDPVIVATLLAKGADVNATRIDGATALTEARKNGSQEIIALLTKAGAK